MLRCANASPLLVDGILHWGYNLLSMVICAPVYSVHDGLASQVEVGIAEGLKRESSIHCDGLISLSKSALTNTVVILPPHKVEELDHALRVALDLANEW